MPFLSKIPRGLLRGVSLLVPTLSLAAVEFERQVVYEGEVVHSVQAADFNGDGVKDIIFAGGGGVNLAFAPDFEVCQIMLLPEPFKLSSYHSNIMDVDGDGDIDFIAENRGLYWLECPDNPASGEWELHWITREFVGIHCVTIHDVDENGHPDIVVNNYRERGRRDALIYALGLESLAKKYFNKGNKSSNKFPASILWFTVPANPRNPQAWEPVILADGDAFGGSHYIAFADVNGDGHDEALVGCKGKPFRKGDYFAYWMRESDISSPWSKKTLKGKHKGATHLHGMDLTGDGRTDLVGSLGHGVGITMFESPHFKPRCIDSELVFPHAFEVADIEGDGDGDLFCCAYGSRKLVWFENDGAGFFTRHILSDDQQSYDIYICDLEDDGDLDLVVAGFESKNIVLYRQK